MRRRYYALLCAVVGLALGACGGSGDSSGVTAQAYVKSVCSAIVPFEKDVQSKASALDLTSITNATQGKTALHDFLASVSDSTGHVVAQLKSAGTPKVGNGKAIAGAIVNAFSRLKDTLAQATQKASALPTNSAQAFRTAAQALGTSVRSTMTSIGSSLSSLQSSDLEKAATSEPSCKGLSG
jgi:hypothetical protein